jgi:hypothetical protein
MKMKDIKTKSILLVAVLGLLAPISVQGQFLKKLKKNVEDKIVNKASEKTDELLNGEGEKTSAPEKEKPSPKTGPASTNKTSPNSIPIGNQTQNKSPEIEDDNIITYKAPNKDFMDVVIQSHKGLPRYGDVYYYRGVTAPTHSKAYRALLELKFMEDLFKDMDRSKLTSYNYADNDLKAKNSNKAQHHLLMLVKDIFSDENMQEYFCDPEAKAPCNFTNAVGERTIVPSWGGTRNNEFAQNRSYSKFIKNHYEALRDWSETFYENGSQVAYFVARGAVAEKYDFKDKGYWIGNIFSIGGDFILHNSNFLAYTENEKTLKNTSKRVFLSVDPTEAKEFNLQSRSPVFVVFKVKVTPRITNTTHVDWEFELESTAMEFYKDAPLTKKMGEVDMRTAKFKD